MSKVKWYVLLGLLGMGVVVAVGIGLRGCSAKAPSVTLTWRAPEPRTGITIVGYNVYRRASENTSFVRIATQVSGLTYEDMIVNRGMVYRYVVTSIDQRARESRFSEEVRAEIR